MRLGHCWPGNNERREFRQILETLREHLLLQCTLYYVEHSAEFQLKFIDIVVESTVHCS